ncbi:MAG TPA: hypothetical protein VN176_11320 [Verrucomicrobiae bacterium]|jgi:Tol biopolymer transport system component|nr:hypothetical protein [Verrucomicrobiae bacterium]
MDRTILLRRSNNRSVALLALFAFLAGGSSSGRADRELAGLAGFSQAHKGALLWYDASGRLLVANAGQIIDPLGRVTAFSKSPGRTYPSLSPDGKKVAFVQTENLSQDEKREESSIWIVDVDRGTLDKVAVLPWASALSWSPAGDKLAFISEGLKILTLGDKHITLITADTSSDAIPSWSPDEHQIAYESVTGAGDHRVFHVNIADLLSGEIKTIAEGRSPSWSPKGDQIAYLDSGEQAYFAVSTTGANKKLLVKAGYAAFKGPLLGMWLVWSPDQLHAIYNAYYDGGVEAIGVDLLTGKKTIIKREGYFAAVDWRP